jgi:D-serine deaminase-like pyridoxal phosphate-dependent protein
MFALPVTRLTGTAGLEAARARRSLPASSGRQLELGDRVYFRDLEAGELCERFDRLFLVTGTTIRDEVPTYRGEAKSFL